MASSTPLKRLDLQDLQLVVGLSLLGYGLFLVYPPAAYIGLGSLFISPIVLPSFIRAFRQRGDE